MSISNSARSPKTKICRGTFSNPSTALNENRKANVARRTPVGVGWGLVEAWRFHWWLAVLMAGLLSIVSVFMWMTLKRIRVERTQS
jgi:hypothetical protein